MIYYLLSFFSAILISTMIATNGALSGVYGAYLSSIIIHIIGLFCISLLCLVKKKTLLAKKIPWYLFLGGTIGVVTTVANNLAFGKISISAIVALGLFSQTVTAILIDQYGLFHMSKQPFKKSKLIGLFFTALGIVCMLSGTKVLLFPILLSILSGISLIFARTINGRLSDETSIYLSTWYNFFTGFIVSIIMVLLLGEFNLPNDLDPITRQPFIYIGGILGVLVVMLSNICVTKIPALFTTLILFVGQIFTGILIDILMSGTFSKQNFWGGLLVAIGLSANVLSEYRKKSL